MPGFDAIGESPIGSLPTFTVAAADDPAAYLISPSARDARANYATDGVIRGEATNLNRFSPASVTASAGPGPPPQPVVNPVNPNFVHFDPGYQVPIRTRKHMQQVSSIFNGMMRLGDLIETSPEIWRSSFQTSDAQIWDPSLGPPLTVADAMDRIGQALKDLRGGSGV